MFLAKQCTIFVRIFVPTIFVRGHGTDKYSNEPTFLEFFTVLISVNFFTHSRFI